MFLRPFTFACVKMFIPPLYFCVCTCFYLPYTLVCVNIFLLALYFHVCKCVYLPSSSTQASPAQIEGVSVYSPCLFGKGIVAHARQTCKQQSSHLLKQNLSETIKPIDNSCMLSSNPSINPVVC